MPQVEADGPTLYRHLLERSGLLREPVAGRVDFIHRTFQEYLAARSAIANADDVGQIVSHAHLDQWHEVVIMAVGHATFTQREELISGLLHRADHEPDRHDTLALLALASLETAPELSANLRAEIQRRAKTLLPPKSLTAAKSFASAGSFVLDLLANAQPRTAKETVATIRALAETGTEEALSLIARYRDDDRKMVREQLVRIAHLFDEVEYTKTILRHIPIESATIDLDANGRSASLQYHRNATYFEINMQNGTPFDATAIPQQTKNISLHSYQDLGTIDFSGRPHLPTLTRINLSAVDVIGDIVQSVPNLNTLTIAHHIPPRWSTHPPAGLAVKNLTVFGVPTMNDLNPVAFMQIESLTLHYCLGISDLEGIGRPSPHLQKLEFIKCFHVDIAQISEAENLRHLKFTDTWIDNPSPLFELKQLQTLVLHGYSDKALQIVRKRLPHTEILADTPR